MITVFNDIYSVLWVDLRFLRRHWLSTLVISLINPLLYLVAFGYGLGSGINFGGVGYLEFVIPGIIALTSMSTSFSGSSSKLHIDRLFYRSFDACLMSPISLFSIVVGKALIGLVRGLLSSVAILAVGVVLSPVLLVTPLFVLVLFTSCFVFAMLGVLIGLVMNTHHAMGTFSNLVMLPMTFLSGTFFSLNQLPDALKAALYVLPLTHSSASLRAAALGQPFPWLSFVAFLGFGLFFFVCSMVVLKRSSA